MTTTIDDISQKLNIRHSIDPALVKAAVDKAIEQHERRRLEWKQQARDNVDRYERDKALGKSGKWAKIPNGPDYVDPLIDQWVAKEREHYALVRIVELPKPGKRFILVYGDADDATVTSGTGPFETLQRASDWFTNGGR